MRRKIACAAGDPAHKFAATRGESQSRADRVPVAFGPLQLDADPVFLTAHVIVQQHWRIVQAGEHYVHAAIVVVVSDGEAAPQMAAPEGQTGSVLHVAKDAL